MNAARSAVTADVENPATSRTPVAVVGTLAEFRPDPLDYDLTALVEFVGGLAPDLLCLDMTLDQWQRRDFGGLPAEYRDALLPLADQTDIVVVPIAATGHQPAEPVTLTGLRGWLLNRLRAAGAELQHGARTPVDVGAGFRHARAGLILHLVDDINGSRARKAIAAHRAALVERIVQLAQRDPGRRILVVVNARHCHQLRRQLRRQPEIKLLQYSRL